MCRISCAIFKKLGRKRLAPVRAHVSSRWPEASSLVHKQYPYPGTGSSRILNICIYVHIYILYICIIYMFINIFTFIYCVCLFYM